jgi:hypothetical protein
MRKKLIVFIILIVAGLVVYLALGIVGPSSWVDRSQIRQCEALIKAVDQFRAERGRIPSAEEAEQLMIRLGWTLSESCPCYRETGQDSYEIWFGTTLGNSMTYSSVSQGWTEGG